MAQIQKDPLARPLGGANGLHQAVIDKCLVVAGVLLGYLPDEHAKSIPQDATYANT